jgi:hypothetical protein
MYDARMCPLFCLTVFVLCVYLYPCRVFICIRALCFLYPCLVVNYSRAFVVVRVVVRAPCIMSARICHRLNSLGTHLPVGLGRSQTRRSLLSRQCWQNIRIQPRPMH